MFNGLIREIGKVTSFNGDILDVKSNLKPNLGDSISINGACLSVVKVSNDGFSVEISSQSKKMLALQNYKDKVHLEPAMKLGDSIDGHLLQGHIDGIGEIYAINKNSNGTDFFIKLPQELMKFTSSQGSIAIDGVSLTIAQTMQDSIRICVIPITMRDTLFGSFSIGRKVNIETDMFARYIYKIISNKNTTTWDDIDKIMSIY